MVKITSKEIKLAVLKYYRFNRSMATGTEVRNADVIAITDNLKTSYEVEIKISMSDLNKDFENKRVKHAKLIHDCDYNPNYLYFCVPCALLDKASTVVEDNNERYGIMVYKRYNNNKPGGYIEIFKNAKKLNSANNDKLYVSLVKRISSELVNMYIKYEK